ncbi:MAG: hypothetical protein WBW58_05075 [Candidatus Acidiferrum sp.]
MQAGPWANVPVRAVDCLDLPRSLLRTFGIDWGFGMGFGGLNHWQELLAVPSVLPIRWMAGVTDFRYRRSVIDCCCGVKSWLLQANGQIGVNVGDS